MIGSLVKFVDTDSDENASWTEQLLKQVILPCIGQAQPSFQDVAFTMFGELCRWASKREEIMDCMITEMTKFVLQVVFDPTDVSTCVPGCVNGTIIYTGSPDGRLKLGSAILGHFLQATIEPYLQTRSLGHDYPHVPAIPRDGICQQRPR